MKLSLVVIACGAALAAAQTPSGLNNLPQCGQTCIQNMLALAPSLGCSSTNATCLCENQDFGYGIRDCSNESCPTHADAEKTIAWGQAYCKKALASSGSGATSTASSSGSGSGSSSSSGASSQAPSAISTVFLTAVTKSGKSTLTETTGTTTISGVNGKASAISTSPFTEVLTTKGKTMTTTTGKTTITGVVKTSKIKSEKSSANSAKKSAQSVLSSVKSAASSVNSKASAATGKGNSNKSSNGGAPVHTAAPALIGAAALAILAL